MSDGLKSDIWSQSLVDNPCARCNPNVREQHAYLVNINTSIMKKVSFALLASFFVAGAAMAQTPNNGIVTTHDASVAAQIEQHARDVQAQPQVVEHEAPVAHESAPHKGAHHHRHHHGKHHAQSK
ncbi:hypothetical protein [Caballeronia insecticola]|uniref:hypothetical protein n=1 Tax=Caballeronia insecticola TaxID=758793 RepID=UPI001182390A|nr:hypothetical protein [Caballeronia insecticola]